MGDHTLKAKDTATFTNHLLQNPIIGRTVLLTVRGHDFQLWANCPPVGNNSAQLQDRDGDGIPPDGPDNQWNFWAHWYAFSGADGDFGHSEDCPHKGHPLHVKLEIYNV